MKHIMTFIIWVVQIISGDSDLPVREDLGDRRRNHDIQKSNKALAMDDNEGSDGGAERVEPEEDEFYKQARLLKEAKQAAKAAKYSRLVLKRLSRCF